MKKMIYLLCRYCGDTEYYVVAAYDTREKAEKGVVSKYEFVLEMALE